MILHLRAGKSEGLMLADRGKKMAEKQGKGVANVANARPDLFIGGYFSSLIKAGKRPSHGYPTNHLPEVPASATMEFVISMGELNIN